MTSDDIELGLGDDDKVKDVTAITHKTFDTFASDWSGCTNVAFEKVLVKFKASRSGDKVRTTLFCPGPRDNLLSSL